MKTGGISLMCAGLALLEPEGRGGREGGRVCWSWELVGGQGPGSVLLGLARAGGDRKTSDERGTSDSPSLPPSSVTADGLYRGARVRIDPAHVRSAAPGSAAPSPTRSARGWHVGGVWEACGTRVGGVREASR
ncbi:hypothetical protein SKAU_G00044130 [Synaphobranchus kaupii]|uniref:Uncharacterized protein n=1 Tax=Synaphobranchus kaupii TaxID=118154 RepID=A0A9Q1J8S5_SYNKA|nr:hypothetical protein SKAU_G00044130 [Synaphobranchus kaupii]